MCGYMKNGLMRSCPVKFQSRSFTYPRYLPPFRSSHQKMVPSRAYRTEGLDGVSLGFRNQMYHFNIEHDYLPGCFLEISDQDACPSVCVSP